MQQSQVTSGAQSFGALAFANFPAPQALVCWLAWDGADLWVSENGNPYAMLSALVAGGGWQDDGTIVRLVTGTDQVSIGVAVPPADQKLYVEGTADRVGESVIEANYVGQPTVGAGLDGGAGVRVIRTRSAAATDFWMSCFAAAPTSFAADVGVEVAFHAEPPTDAFGSKIAFLIEGTRGSANVYTGGIEGFEHEMLVRAVTLSAGNAFPVRVLGSTAFLNGTGGDVVITAGNAESTDAAARVGGDLELRAGLPGAAGVAGSVRVIPQSTTQVPLIVQGFAAATADRQQWQNTALATALAVEFDGSLHAFERAAAAGSDSVGIMFRSVTSAGTRDFTVYNEGDAGADSYRLAFDDAGGDRLFIIGNNAGTQYLAAGLNAGVAVTVSVGTAVPAVAGALVELASTDSLFVPMRMTTAQALAIAVKPTAGMYYDTTLSKLRVWTGAAYETITSA